MTIKDPRHARLPLLVLTCVLFICLTGTTAYAREVYWLNSLRPSADYETDYNGCRGMQATPDERKTDACLVNLGWCPVKKSELKSGATCGMGRASMRKQANLETREFNDLYNSLKIGMSKTDVAGLMKIEPSEKAAITTRDGIFECWSWNTRSGDRTILFGKGAVTRIETSSCDRILPGDY